jgi:hypothetical protein
MRRLRDYTILPWLISVATLVGAYTIIGTLSPRVPRLILLATGSGVLFIWIGLTLRGRFGVWPLAAWTVAATAFGSLALGSVAADALDVPREWGAGAVGFLVAPAFLSAALLLHRLASRPPRPPLERDFPWALAAFAVGLWVGFVTLIAVLSMTVPRIG